MANIPLKSIKFPDLADTYTVPSNAGELPYNKSATYPDDTVGKALQDKPDADGTIANAEQLTSNIYEEDNIPYNFRTSGGSIDIGDRETDMIVGGTVAWNQLCGANARSLTFGDVTFTHNSVNNSWTASGTANTGTRLWLDGIQNAIAGHKLLITTDSKEFDVFSFSNGNKFGKSIVVNCNAQEFIDGWEYYGVVLVNGTSYSDTFHINCIDLTAMFGTTIADYIYSLEQANAGAGVAWFRKLFPKPYYAYNAGGLMSVQASSHDMVGFNAWDEEWEVGSIDGGTGQPYSLNTAIRAKNYCKCLPNTVYYCKTDGVNNIGICLYDANYNFIATYYRTDANLTTPTNAHYFKVFFLVAYGTTYKSDTCINLSWDGERDGEYEPYVKHSYALDSDLVLRGIPKLNNGNLYYDGDRYEADGTVTRRYGIVDMGSLDWSYASGASLFYSRLPLGVKSQNTGIHCVCSKYTPVIGYGDGGINDSSVDKAVSVGSSYIGSTENLLVRDLAYNDGTAFKTAMDGVYLVYELATPTTETADPYTNPQIVNDFGTEEYVDYAVSQSTRDVAIPVGHQTQYMANLKAKLEMSPNSPEGAGDYIVRQTNGENEYVTLASNATIQNIISRIEALEGQNAES